MKNLKKVLAMVLVVAMVASFAVTASATSYAELTDVDTITYTTAVEALNTLGVIEGKTDGAFHPTDDVTRGQFAKMAAYVLNGGVDAAASYATSATTAFSDVASGRYYTAGIGYVASKGIVDGFTDGTFRPDNSVTGIQAAKILLGALGYDSSIEGYTGTGWKQNVLNDGEDAGLFAGLSSVDLSANLTREAAAQMIWNALQAETVEYASTGVNVSAGDVSISVGASAATPTGDTLAVTAYHDAIDTDANLTADAFGRPITVYTLGGDIEDGGTKLATEVATPAATYTTAVTSGTIYTDLGLTSGTTGTAVTNITHNGTDTTTASFTVARNGQTPVPESGNGVVTEVYTNNKGVPTCIVTITPTYGTLAITTGKETNGSTYQQYTVTDSEDGTVSGKVYTSALNGEEDTVVLNGTVAKGDHVTFYTATENGTTTVYITPVTKVTATMTGSKTTSAGTVYTIGGESKSLSAANGAAATLTGFNSEATFELDAYGYVLAKSDSDDTVYLFVAAASEVNTLVGTKVVASYAADVVDTDGVVSTVTVSKVDDTAVTDEAQIVVNTLYIAEKDSKGNYELSTVDGQESSDHTGITLTAGDPDVDDIKANNATKFVTLNFDSEDAFDGTVTTVTGLANITTATGVSLVYVDTDDDGIANIVYIFDAGSASADAITFAYYTGASTYDGATNTTTYTFIVDGVETEIKGTEGLDGAKLYSISAANAATAVVFGTTANTKASAAVVNKGGLLYSGDTYVTTVTDSVPVYVISNGAVETLTAADLSTAVTGALAYTVANGAVTSIVIVVPAE